MYFELPGSAPPKECSVILEYPQVVEKKSLHTQSYSELNNEKASQ